MLRGDYSIRAGSERFKECDRTDNAEARDLAK
jgi:hypothetical protein